MTSDLNSSELGIHDHNNEPSSSKLVPKVVTYVDTTAPSKQELDLLFGPLYDEFFTAGTSCVNKSSSPTDNSTQQLITPTTTITAEDNMLYDEVKACCVGHEAVLIWNQRGDKLMLRNMSSIFGRSARTKAQEQDDLNATLCTDAILLIEVNRLLWAGGNFAWAAQSVYKHEPLLEEQWE
ncbi:copia protein, partial [Tanacetum coccineum]